MYSAPENEMGFDRYAKFCLDKLQWELAFFHNSDYHSATF